MVTQAWRNTFSLNAKISEGRVVAAEKRSRGAFAVLLGVVCLVVVFGLPAPALAVQQHSGTEGLVIHQLGHLLFLFGMIFLLFRMRHPESRRLSRGSGWLEFKLCVILIILWNLLTFYGHWHQELINPDKFVTSGGRTTGFIVSGPLDALFYLSRLDHLLLLPAFVFLLLALRKWREQE
ncbi:MAG: hypothetical protein C4563_04365 [Desulfobulbus sp.]|jgi:hypothetical protein|nr:MAG: hypothetical protein C4563_04365 [Desulfobulbus sp.]